MEAMERIRFPEINAFAEPVVIVLAEAEFAVQQELLAYCFVASVISENKGCREFVHES